MFFSGARRFGVMSPSGRARLGLSVGVVALACRAGGAGARSGASGATAHVYLSYVNCCGTGHIVEADVNGAHAKTIAKGVHNPVGLAVSSSHLYWASAGRGTIVEANLNGTNPKAIVKGQSGVGPMAIGSQLYWISGANIVEANLNGTNPKTIVTGQSAVEIAVGGGHLYWASSGAFGNHNGTIGEANLDGTGVKTIAQGQPTPSGVAVAGNHLYWSNGASDTVVEANLDGTSPKAIVRGQYVQLLGDLVAGAGHLYWTWSDTSDPYWTTVEANLDGTHAQSIAAQKDTPLAIAAGP